VPSPYALGIDVGTAYTAAATYADGRVDVLTLSHSSQIIPTAVYVGTDGYLIGEPALHRLTTEPTRVATNFKRRVGDTTPLVLGGHPVSPELLLSKVMSSVVERAAAERGGAPAAIVLSHPANWGPYKREVFAQALSMAGLSHAATLTEPEAAAVAYARVEHVPSGAVLAVYDFGGGTFDAAVVRREGDAFTVLGTPTGVERLGGIDIDAAVLAHVAEVAALDADAVSDDPRTLNAMAALQQACIVAKEALSSDTAAAIPVFVPGAAVDTVRLTRAELDVLIEPLLRESIAALRRSIESAGVEPADLHAVLLVGGSSRIPRVRQIVATEFGRPVALDAHSKHPVAIGAAWTASQDLHSTIDAPAEPEARPAAPTEPPSAARKKWPLAVGIAAVAVAVLAVAGAALALRSDGSDGSGDDDSGDTDSAFGAAAVSFLRAWSDGDYDAMLEIADEDVADTFIELPFPDPRPELEGCAEQVGGETLCVFDADFDSLVFELAENEPRIVGGYLEESSLYYLITGRFARAWQEGDEETLFDLALDDQAQKFVDTPFPEFGELTFSECEDADDGSSACNFFAEDDYTLVLAVDVIDDRGSIIVFAGLYNEDGVEVPISDFPASP
jgi:hypothetical protein